VQERDSRLTSDSVAFGAMFFALLYAVVRCILRLGWLLSETDEVMRCISAAASKPERVRIVVPMRAAGDWFR
jgi:hypothetical protein